MSLLELPSLQFFEKLWEELILILLFFERFVEFNNEAVWSWAFVCWDVFDH